MRKKLSKTKLVKAMSRAKFGSVRPVTKIPNGKKKPPRYKEGKNETDD